MHDEGTYWKKNLVYSNIYVQGPVVQRPISTNPGSNFNPDLYISLFKYLFSQFILVYSIIKLKKNGISPKFPNL